MDEVQVLGFDLEIAEDRPEDGEIDWSVPLGVTCVGLATNGAASWIAPGAEENRYASRFNLDGIYHIVDDALAHNVLQGYYPITWNGMGFDFRVLAQEAKGDTALYDRICDLAWNHIDIAFQMRVEKGYMISLDTAAKGLGVAGKTEGMSGALAPVMWRQGLDEQEKVLAYVKQDAQATLDVYNALMAQKILYWTTRSGAKTRSPWIPTFVDAEGKPNGTVVPFRLPTVREVTQFCTPADTSWMSFQPRPLQEYYGWTGIFP